MKTQAHSTNRDKKTLPWVKILLGIPHHLIWFYPEVKSRLRMITILILAQAILLISGGALVFVQVFTDNWYNYILGAIFGFICSWVIRFGFITRRPNPGRWSRRESFISMGLIFFLFMLLAIPLALGLNSCITSYQINEIRSEKAGLILKAYEYGETIESDPVVHALIQKKNYLQSLLNQSASQDSVINSQLNSLDSSLSMARTVALQKMKQEHLYYTETLTNAHFPVTEWSWQVKQRSFQMIYAGMGVLFIIVSILHYRLVVRKKSIIAQHLRQHDRLVIQKYHRAAEEQLRSFLESKFAVMLKRPPLHDDAPFGITPVINSQPLKRKTF